MANLSNIDNKFLVTTGGNVLIGTTADVATVRLQVKNASAAAVLRLTGGSDSWDFDTYYTDNKLFIKSSGAAGTVMTLLGASGNVGIGTDSPAHKLAIEGGADTVIQMSHGSGAVYNWALAAQYITNNAFEIVPSTVVGGSVFTTPVATFKSDGNVGIGTTTPQYKFHTYLTNGQIAMFGSNAQNSVGQYCGIGLGQVLAGGTSYQKISIVSEGRGSGNYISDLHFLVDTAGDAGSADLTDSKMMISGANGYVGIGTSSPDRLLDVSGTGNVYAKIQSTNSTAAGIELDTNGGSIENWLIQADEGVGGLAFYDLGRTAYRMIIDSSGNVGIGTATPFAGAELDVYGDIVLMEKNWALRGNNASADFAIEELSGSSFSDANIKFYIKSGGNVGIGTTIPGGKLAIGSGLAKTDTTTSSVLYLGQSNEASNYKK